MILPRIENTSKGSIPVVACDLLVDSGWMGESEIVGQLIDFVRGAFAFADLLKDSGMQNEIVVRLSHEDGSRLLALLTGGPDQDEVKPAPAAVDLDGFRQLKIAGLCFAWPLVATVKNAEHAVSELMSRVVKRDNTSVSDSNS